MRSAQSLVTTAASLLLFALPACAPDDGSAGAGAGAQVASGVFKGTYEVPTVTPELAKAAVYDVPEVEWTATGDAAELSYDLPLGLVGKPVRVKFKGPLAASASTASLTGAPGTASCDVAPASVSCHEVMGGLAPLAPDYTVIEELAATEYAGPASHRLDVAKAFASDPIGVVRIDLRARVAAESEKPEG